MSGPIRLMLAVFFAAMMVFNVNRGDAFRAAVNASLATYWLMRWMEDDV